MKRLPQLIVLVFAMLGLSLPSLSRAQLVPTEALTELAASPTFVTSMLIQAHSGAIAESMISEISSPRGKLTDKQLRAVLGVLEKSVTKTRLFFERLQVERDAEYRSMLATSFPPSSIRSQSVPNLTRFLAWAKENQAFYVQSSTVLAFGKVYQRLVPTEKAIPFCQEVPEDQLVEQGMSKDYRRGLRCLLNSKELEEVAPPSLNLRELRSIEQKTRLDAVTALGSADAFRFGSPFGQFFNGLNGSVIPGIQRKFSAEITAFQAELREEQKSLLRGALSS